MGGCVCLVSALESDLGRWDSMLPWVLYPVISITTGGWWNVSLMCNASSRRHPHEMLERNEDAGSVDSPLELADN